MTPNRLLLAALLACLMQPALAEEDPAPAPATRDEAMRIVTRGGHLVKNAPYSAQAVSERLQQLPDGNRIERRTRSASYRDSAGRTRHEVNDDKGELRTVTISDPVAGAVWILHPQNRIAQRVPSPADVARIEKDARARVMAHFERMRKEGRLGAIERQAQDRVALSVERENDRQRETVRVIRLPAAPGADPAAIGSQLGAALSRGVADATPGTDTAAIGSQLAAVLNRGLADSKWAAKAVSRDLGAREFDGIKAEGKLRSYEIPAGAVGNRNPIQVADETWYAPELQLTVYAKHSDPRSGEFVYRLEGVKRGEPDAALFAVPADYQVRQIGKRLPGKNDD